MRTSSRLRPLVSGRNRENRAIPPMLMVANIMKSFHWRLASIVGVSFETTKSENGNEQRRKKAGESQHSPRQQPPTKQNKKTTTHSKTTGPHSQMPSHNGACGWGRYPRSISTGRGPTPMSTRRRRCRGGRPWLWRAGRWPRRRLGGGF